MSVAVGRAPLPVVLGFALAALALRGVALWSFVVPLLCAAGVLALQAQPAARVDRNTWLLVTAAGVAACALVRLALPGVPLRTTTLGLIASAAAAFGEEIVFRRGLYGALERSGPLIAVIASALVFGLVHVPMYGWAVVPVDVGAGLVFGWQRWASGTWTAPAFAHAAANVMGAL
jgi:membrane protease YdiL (CAAX protease family)